VSYYVTFYSYRGGVGRTVTLVNVAVRLVQSGHSVFLWDLDLEAPGLLHLPFFEPLRDQTRGGMVDLLATPRDGDLAKRLSGFVLEHPDFRDRLRLLPAGVPDDSYSRLFAAIEWDRWFGEGVTAGSVLFENARQAIDTFQSDFLLIDSRTGLTDVGAICTVQLPDTVVLVYSYGHQNQAGLRSIHTALGQADRLKKFRRRPLNLLRVATLVPDDKPDLAAERRAAFHATPAGARLIDLAPHVEIPLNSSLLLEERIFTREFPDHPLAKAYGAIAEKLIEAAAVAPPPEQPVRLEKPDPRHERGRKFEDKVAELLSLMGFDLERNVSIAGREVDIVAVKADSLREQRFLVECKGRQKASGVEDLGDLHARLVAYRRDQPRAEALLVSESGFSPEAKEHAGKLGISLKTYEDLLTGLVDFGGYLVTLIQDVEGKDIERLYVEPEVRPEGAEPLPLPDYIGKWLADPGALHLTLLGDYGTGKTWFSRRLASTLARRHREDPARHRFPVRVDLKKAAKALSLEGLLFEHFQHQVGRQVNPKSVLRLLSEGRLVLIFDGFDEMATQANWQVTLANFRELARAAEGRAKVLLTCRTHYFKEQAQVEELVEGRPPGMTPEGTELYREVSGRAGFSLAFLRDFTPAQISEYLGRACGERAAEVEAVIERIGGLREIAPRPVLLEMIVRTAPKLVEARGDIKVAHLYEAYTEEWLARQDWRLRLTRAGRTALVEELAAKLWETESARLHYRELAEVLAGLLKDQVTTFRELEEADQEVRSASFLTRDAAGNYGFSHRSFLEFFLARRTARRLKEAGEEGASITEALRMRRFSPPVISLLADLGPREAAGRAAARVIEQPYTRLSSENALLILMALGWVIPQPAQLEGAELAGLSLAGAGLARANLRRARLSGCDLSGAKLDHASLAEADLERASLDGASCQEAAFRSAKLAGVSLRSADLRGADFSGADLSFATLAAADLRNAKWDGAALDGAGFYHAKTGETKNAKWIHRPGSPEASLPDFTSLVQTGPGGPVRAVAWSPKGKLVAVGADDGTIGIFDGVTGLCRRVLFGPSGPVTSIAWQADGARLASGSSDKTVRLWDPETGRQERSLEGQYGVNAVAWRPDGGMLANGSSDKTVRLWDPETGRQERSLEGHQYGVNAVAWRPDGGMLASGSSDKTVRLWDPETGRQERSLEGHQGVVMSVAWRPDGGMLASGSDDNIVRLWDPETGRQERSLEGHQDWVRSVAWRPDGGPDGGMLASGSSDKTVRLWDPETGRQERSLEGHQRGVNAVAWRPDGGMLASGSYDNTVRLWDPETGRQERSLEGHQYGVNAVAWRPDGGMLASGSYDKTVRLWDPETGRQERSLEGHQGWVRSVAWRPDGGPDGGMLASGSDDQTVRLWDPETGRQERSLEGHQGLVRSVAWRPDGARLASGSDDNTVRLWDPETGRQERSLEGHRSGVWSVVWLKGGRRLASASADGTIRIWDPASGRCLVVLYNLPNGGWLAITPDNRFTGDAAGKRLLTFVQNWAVYPASLFPELADPEAVRRAMA